MRKRTLIVVSLMLVLMVTAPSMAQKTTINFWGFQGGAVGDVLTEKIEKYKSYHPDVDFQIVYGSEGLGDPQKLMTAIAAGTGPDLVLFDRFAIGEWAARGAFESLDAMAEARGITGDDFVPYTWAECQYDGKLYGIPYFFSTMGLMWNKDLFAKAGLNPDIPPTTWDDYLEYCQKLTRQDERGILRQVATNMFLDSTVAGRIIYTLAWQNGSEVFDEVNKVALLEDPGIVRSLAFMKDVMDVQGGIEAVSRFSGGAEILTGYNQFMMDQEAMQFSVGLWNFSNFEKYTPDLNIGVAQDPYPADGTPVSFLGGWGFVVPIGASHPEQAMDFIDFLTSTEEMPDFAEKHGNLVARWSALEVVESEIIPRQTFAEQRQVFVDLAAIGRSRPVCAFGKMLWDELARAAENTARGKLTPEQAAKQAQQTIQREVDDFYR